MEVREKKREVIDKSKSELQGPWSLRKGNKTGDLHSIEICHDNALVHVSITQASFSFNPEAAVFFSRESMMAEGLSGYIASWDGVHLKQA